LSDITSSFQAGGSYPFNQSSPEIFFQAIIWPNGKQLPGIAETIPDILVQSSRLEVSRSESRRAEEGLRLDDNHYR
jgi:hypothetical protein